MTSHTMQGSNFTLDHKPEAISFSVGPVSSWPDKSVGPVIFSFYKTNLKPIMTKWEKSSLKRLLVLELKICFWGNFSLKKTSGLKPFIRHLKPHKVLQQGCFFCHYSLATSTTNWAKTFRGLLFYAYIWNAPRKWKYWSFQLPNMSSACNNEISP